MRTRAKLSSWRLQPGRPLQFAMLVGVVAAFSLAVAACSGDDNGESDSAQTAGGVVTASPRPESTPGPGTLTPLGTKAPPATASGAGSPAAASTPGVVAMRDLVPCGSEMYYEEQLLPRDNDGYAVTYKDVPQGTPILFPFEEGTLRLADAREGAILLVFDVEGVGVLSIQAAGTETLDRTKNHVAEGTVIGHFDGTFGEEDTDVFVGQQLFAFVSTEELELVNGTPVPVPPLQIDVAGCIEYP